MGQSSAATPPGTHSSHCTSPHLLRIELPMATHPPTFSAAKCRRGPDGDEEYELSISGSASQLFQDWAQACDDQALCSYFRAVCCGLSDRQLQHYHLKVCNGRFNTRQQQQAREWVISVYYGQQEADDAGQPSSRSGPLQVSRCMSCDMDCPIILGVLGEDAAAATTGTTAAPAPAPAPTPAPAAPAAPADASSMPVTDEAAGAAPHTAAGLAATATTHQGTHHDATDSTPADQQQQQHQGDSLGPEQATTRLSNGQPPQPQEQPMQSSEIAQHAGSEQQQALQPLPQQGAGGQEQESQHPQPLAAPQQRQRQQQQPAPPQGVGAQGLRSRDTLIKETQHCRVWLDAKARPMFVITPKEHIEQLSQLSDLQLVDLFRTVPDILQTMGCGCTTAILNQGDNRNHAHLHLKVRVHEREFERAAAGWSAEHRAKLQALKQFRDTLPPEQRGTHAAFMLKRQGQQQQQHGDGRQLQHQQRGGWGQHQQQRGDRRQQQSNGTAPVTGV